MRGVALRVLSSSFVEAEVKPPIVDLPPESRAFVKVTLKAKRVGRWGVHGMALEVRGTEASAAKVSTKCRSCSRTRSASRCFPSRSRCCSIRPSVVARESIWAGLVPTISMPVFDASARA